MDFKKFKKRLDSFIPDALEQAKEDGLAEGIASIKEALESEEANSFTMRMNEMFKSRGLKDEDGNFVRVENPRAAFDRDQYSHTEDEERWWRSQELYGPALGLGNILKELGFKYTSK